MTHVPVGGAGRGGGRVSRFDIEGQKAINAEAPAIPHLWRRVGQLFAPYRRRIAATGALVVFTSAIAVVPPLIVKRVFDSALFPADGSGPHVRLLAELVASTVGLYIANAGLGVWQ